MTHYDSLGIIMFSSYFTIRNVTLTQPLFNNFIQAYSMFWSYACTEPTSKPLPLCPRYPTPSTLLSQIHPFLKNNPSPVLVGSVLVGV